MREERVGQWLILVFGPRGEDAVFGSPLYARLASAW